MRTKLIILLLFFVICCVTICIRVTWAPEKFTQFADDEYPLQYSYFILCDFTDTDFDSNANSD